MDAFAKEMSKKGYVEGKNLTIEWRYANGDYAVLPELAAEIVRMNVDLIVTNSLPSTLAAQRATKSIPIVFAILLDPVGSGVTSSLARPDGNATGQSLMSIDTVSKQIELLAVIVPRLARIAVLVNPKVPIHAEFLKHAQVAGQQVGAKVFPVEASTPEDLERGFKSIVNAHAQAVIIASDSFFGSRSSQIARLALEHRVASIFPYGADAESGGLLSYGPDLQNSYRRAAEYVDKIFKGAKPIDLPIEQPTIFQFMINLKTAKALGIKIPQELFLRADRVIE